jgi:GNAT superfamily N-acetyltransferase
MLNLDTMKEVKIRLLESTDDPLFWTTCELYVESFPRDERGPLGHFAAMISGGDGDDSSRSHVAIADVDGELAGFRYFSYHPDAGLGFFVFLAVDERFRKLGIGTALLDFGKEICLNDAQEMGGELDAIIFECERPELARTPDERDFREKRLRYFANRGGILLSKEHVQPALGAGRNPVPLYLFCYDISNKRSHEEILISTYRHLYGHAPESEYELSALASFRSLWPSGVASRWEG